MSQRGRKAIIVKTSFMPISELSPLLPPRIYLLPLEGGYMCITYNWSVWLPARKLHMTPPSSTSTNFPTGTFPSLCEDETVMAPRPTSVISAVAKLPSSTAWPWYSLGNRECFMTVTEESAAIHNKQKFTRARLNKLYCCFLKENFKLLMRLKKTWITYNVLFLYIL